SSRREIRFPQGDAAVGLVGEGPPDEIENRAAAVVASATIPYDKRTALSAAEVHYHLGRVLHESH
ncbi:jg25851, partial [Pararge aegeria aegeria]